jgi:hypothetical protein
MKRRNSTGPQSAVGKVRSSYNALRHGLAAKVRCQPASAAEIDQLARAMCGNDEDSVLFTAARAIAEHEFVLSAVRGQKIVAIERLKEATAIALRKGDNSFDLGKARFMTAWLAYREIQILIPQVMKEHNFPMPPMEVAGEIVPIELKALLAEQELSEEEEERLLVISRREIRRQQRTEYEALEEAVPDLIRLERYERRAWSRHKRAIHEFVLIKFTRAMMAGRRAPMT